MADRAHSSTSVSGGTSESTSGTTVRSHSGQGRTVNNLVFLAACLAIMVGSFWAFASYPNSPLLWIIGLVLYSLALLIPVSILQSSTAKKVRGGRTLAMDVPTSTEVAGTERTASAFDDGPRDIRERDAQVRARHQGGASGRTAE